jgi:hypothetical protein
MTSNSCGGVSQWARGVMGALPVAALAWPLARRFSGRNGASRIVHLVYREDDAYRQGLRISSGVKFAALHTATPRSFDDFLAQPPNHPQQCRRAAVPHVSTESCSRPMRISMLNCALYFSIYVLVQCDIMLKATNRSELKPRLVALNSRLGSSNQALRVTPAPT